MSAGEYGCMAWPLLAQVHGERTHTRQLVYVFVNINWQERDSTGRGGGGWWTHIKSG